MFEPWTRVSGLGCRHYQCIMLFFMMALMFSMRFNLSVAIVAMTSPTGTNTDNEVRTGTGSHQSRVAIKINLKKLLKRFASGDLLYSGNSQTN